MNFTHQSELHYLRKGGIVDKSKYKNPLKVTGDVSWTEKK